MQLDCTKLLRMQIFEPFNLSARIIEPTKPIELPDHLPSLDFDDPDAMYDLWLKPSIKDEPGGFQKNTCIKQLKDIFHIYLDLNKSPRKPTRHQLLKEVSIQVSLYEALIFRHMFLSCKSGHWKLNKSQNKNEQSIFYFKKDKEKVRVEIDKNSVHLDTNNQPIGILKIDMEHILLEKLHGRLFDKRFILDPIWIKRKTKVDAVKIQIDQYKTEIVHKPKHKETLWTGNRATSRMLISKNLSLSLNKKLLLNLKKIHWNNYTLHTMQWYTPWFRLPIQGSYKLIRD